MEEDTISRDSHIKYNLESYLPYICECVDVKDLLLNLDYFTGEQRQEIKQLVRENPVRATQKAFKTLMNKDSPGLFTALLQALEEDYPKIVKLLCGEVVKCDENYRRIVNLFATMVINEIQPLELILSLRKYNVLTALEAEETVKDEQNYGKTRAAWYIITNIHRHVEDWFKYFLTSLIENSCEHLAQILDDDMVQKIKAQASYNPDNENIDEEKQCNDVKEHIQNIDHDVSVDTKIKNIPLPEKDGYTKLQNVNSKGDIADDQNNLNTAESNVSESHITYYNNLEEFDDDITELKQKAVQNDDRKEVPVNTDQISTNDSSDSDDDLNINDLDIGPSDIDVSSYYREWNITTDQDELVNVAEHEIKLRGYQMKLAKQGCEGDNVIIMAPTNSGKTKVACKIVHTVLRNCEGQGKEGKAAFIVEREDLAIQQGKVFCEELPGYRTKVVTGDVQQSRDQYLKDFISRRDIFIVTAQVLLNFLNSKDVGKLNMFDIIVFDECHHADKKHPYKKIMDNYFEQRLVNGETALPQIVGLTASIGVGGKLDRNKAFENMKLIAANLDAKVFCTVDNEADIAEMKAYLNDPDEEFVEVERRSSERFYEDILDALEKIDKFMTYNPNVAQLEGGEKFMKTVSRVPTSSVGTPQFQSWLSDFRYGLSVLKSDNARQILSPCLDYIDQYHNAVLLYTDARICDALNSLGSFVDKRRQSDHHNEADRFQLQLFDDLRSTSYEDEPENPKLLKLKELVLGTIGDDENTRGIIFVKRRELAKNLKKWMHQTAELKHLNANAFLGQVVSRGEGGMTKCIQKDVLALFRNGKHRLIIATTVAEEGLDIGNCNLVIKYEHVTNENARVQCKGRLRAQNSKYYVLTEKGSSLIEKEEYNARCEKLMVELIPFLKKHMDHNRNRWEGQILQMQRYAKEEREAQSRQRRSVLIDDKVNLHCGNCGTFICSSDDVKKICGMHHIVVTDIREKIVLAQSLQPKHVDKTKGVIFGGSTFCSNEMCVYKYKIGGIVQYRKMEFPVLAIKSLCVKTCNGEMLPSAKQWSKVVFKVESIDTAELGTIIQQWNFN